MSSPLKVSLYVVEKLCKLNGYRSFAGKIILDCACGFGRNGHLLRCLVDLGEDPIYLIGCDLFRKYLLEVKKYNPYDALVVCDIRHLPFRCGIIDHVIASEVIEHLSKQDAYYLIDNLRKLCTGNIILTTPYFPYAQGEIRGNPYERHISFWKEKEFKNAGFETELQAYEEILVAAIKELNLDRFLSRVEKALFRRFVCHLVVYRQRATRKRN